MPQYSYDNITITVSNVIILEFLSVWFAYPSTPLLTILSFFGMREHNNKSL